MYAYKRVIYSGARTRLMRLRRPVGSSVRTVAIATAIIATIILSEVGVRQKGNRTLIATNFEAAKGMAAIAAIRRTGQMLCTTI